jgi:two-component system phosphate regulon response regulator PhoB
MSRAVRATAMEDHARNLPSDAYAQSECIVQCGHLSVDLAKRLVRYRSRSVHLRPAEYSLLVFLITNPGVVFSREQLLAIVSDPRRGLDPRTIDVYIGRLRKAIRFAKDRDMIRTHKNYGYLFE